MEGGCWSQEAIAKSSEGIAFTETFSPTVSWNSVRLFLALTVTNNLIPLQLDIEMAYLYGDIEPGVIIYIRPPQGIQLPNGHVYRKLIWIKASWSNLEFTDRRKTKRCRICRFRRRCLCLYSAKGSRSNIIAIICRRYHLFCIRQKYYRRACLIFAKKTSKF